MGNCQAIDAASLVVQHPNGRVERMYWPVPANEIMKTNPNHYVALIITSCVSDGAKNVVDSGVRVTRVKLLKPSDILALGHAYRLIDSQEVMKGLWAKKYAKLKKKELDVTEVQQNPNSHKQGTASELEVKQGGTKQRHGQKIVASSRGKPPQWRPSLQSISEAGLSQQPKKAAPVQDSRRNGQFQREKALESSFM